MAKPANHDPSASMVSPPDPVPESMPEPEPVYSTPDPVPEPVYSTPDPVPDPCEVVVPSVVGVE